MFLPRTRNCALVIAAVAIAAIGACSDNLESHAACPVLCPGQEVTLRDTTLDAVILDSSVSGFPALGQEPYLLVSTRGDTIDTRAIFRFDSLPATFTRTNSAADSAIAGVDSAFLMLRVDTSAKHPGAPITVSVYDVETGNADSAATDTSVAVLAPLFTPARLLGSAIFNGDSITDSLRVPISSDSLFGFIHAGKRLRVGVQVTGPNRAQLRLGTTMNATPSEIVFKPAKRGDTTGVVRQFILPASITPIDNPLAADLRDFLIVVKGTASPGIPVLAVGGLPGRRVYIRFDLPAAIVDSATVLRATLELNQIPNPVSPDAHDTTTVWPQAVLASAAVTDLSRALQILSAVGQIGLDTLERFTPADSGTRQFEMVQLVRAWQTGLRPDDPRALALRTELEGASGMLYWFTPASGPPALRPRIRITYSLKQSAGSSR